MSATYFGQPALEAFASAIASKLGVQVDFKVGQPRTDGKTVWLGSASKPMTRPEFDALCGSAIHECAHVYYGTCARMAQYAGNGPDRKLRALCFNVASDIADETRIEGVIPSARRMLHVKNRACEDAALASKFFDQDPVWAVLSAGMFWTRLGGAKGYRALKKPKHKLFGYMVSAYRILNRIKHRKGSASGPNRSTAQWNAIANAADELFKLVFLLGDGAGAPDPFASDENFGGPCGPQVAQAEGTAQPADGDTEATSADGANMVEGIEPASDADQTPVQVVVMVPGSGAGGPKGSQGGPVRMNEGLHRVLSLSLRGAVERMARHEDADGTSDGHFSGTGIGRGIERAMIDGSCFTRKDSEAEALNAVVLLDRSGSMQYSLPDVSAVAQAFVDAIKPSAQSVALAAFDDDVKECQDFTRVREGGCTGTDLALDWATAQLASKRGRKLCVIVTDGQPDDMIATQAATEKLAKRGVSVVGVAYGMSGESLNNSMPGAHVVEAQDPVSLGLQLTRIAERVAGAR